MLALVLLLPARALADRTSTVLLQPGGTGAALAIDATSEDQPPADPTPDTGEPDPAPSDPAPDPTPSEPTPPPSDPTPPPSDPAPEPSDPAPAPTDPAPPPSDPAPAPADPAPPADEVPIDPAPASGEPTPSDPAPRDGRATAPRPPASDERQLPTASPTTTLIAPVAPTTSTPAGPDQATDPAKPVSDAGDRSPTKVVRAAFERLGLGTIAAPAPIEGGTPQAAVPAQACTPIGTVAAASAPQVGTGLATHAAARTHRTDDEPPAVRGPPAPLDSPTSPIATAAGASAGPGGASGDRDCAIFADQIVLTLADGSCAEASDSSDHVAPAPASAAARAPPVV